MSRDVSELSTDERLVEEAVEAIGEGRPVVLPTDTVYGLCTSPLAPESLARLKGRGADQPIALIASEVDILLELVPELPEAVVRTLLPGRLTLIFPNPKGRFPLLLLPRHDRRAGAGAPWGSAADRHACGRRRRDEREPPRRAATRGGSTTFPRRSGRRAVLVDGGELLGTPSTVVDLTGPRPSILREGAVPATEVLERLEQQG